jgi:hypothetical protein
MKLVTHNSVIESTHLPDLENGAKFAILDLTTPVRHL